MKRILLIFLSLLFSFGLAAQSNTNTSQVRFFPVKASSDTTASTANDGRMWYDFTTDQYRGIRGGAKFSFGGGSGGGITGTLTSPRIPFASGTSTLTDDSNLTWNNTDKKFVIGTSSIFNRSTNLYWTVTGGGNIASLGLHNVFIGDDLSTTSLNNLSDGNVLIGWRAGKNMAATAHYNVFIGTDAGGSTTGASENVGIGYKAIQFAKGEDNVGVGFGAGMRLGSGAVTSSQRNNTFIGYYAGAPGAAGIVAPPSDYLDANSSIFIGDYVGTDAPSESSQMNILNSLFVRNNTYTNPPPYPQTGNFGLFISSPTARIHIPAGAATANKAPLKFTSGTNLATPEAGAMEYNGTDLFFTPVATRQTFTFNDATQVLTNKTLSTGTVFSAAPIINSGVKFTFSPSATTAGVNIGTTSAAPSSLSNGDMWANTTTHQIGVRIQSSSQFIPYSAGADIQANRIPIYAEATTGRMNSSSTLTLSGGNLNTPNIVATGTISQASGGITSTLGAGTLTSTAVYTVGNSSFGVEIYGRQDNSSALPGQYGELIEASLASGSAVSLSTGTTANVISISLTAGNWDVTGVVNYIMTGATTSDFRSGSSSTSATLGGANTFVRKPYIFTALTSELGEVIPTVELRLSGTTTIYLVAQSTFGAGTVTAYGTVRARRMR